MAGFGESRQVAALLQDWDAAVSRQTCRVGCAKSFCFKHRLSITEFVAKCVVANSVILVLYSECPSKTFSLLGSPVRRARLFEHFHDNCEHYRDLASSDSVKLSELPGNLNVHAGVP